MSALGNIRQVTTNARFMAILGMIEAAGRNQQITLLARARWFKHGLDRFELEFVDPCIETSKKNEPSLAEPEGLTMTWGLLFTNLTPEFLGAEAFARAHKRVCEMLQRLVDGTQDKFQQLWEDHLYWVQQKAATN